MLLFIVPVWFVKTLFCTVILVVKWNINEKCGLQVERNRVMDAFFSGLKNVSSAKYRVCGSDFLVKFLREFECLSSVS
jgi:hypothetical protein